jgi:hypothetical protein
MPKIRFIVFSLLTILAAVLVWFWAFRPVFKPHEYLLPTGFSPNPIIWHHRLVQPDWISKPPDYPGWAKVDAMVRVVVIFVCWITSVVFIEWLYSVRHKKSPESPIL